VSFFNSLPSEKLTPEQEGALVKKNTEDAFIELAMANMREGVIYARHITRGLLEDDEIISVCYETLLRNAKRFRPGIIRFFAFAKPGIRGAFSRNWKKKDTVKNGETVSIDWRPPPPIDMDNHSLEDVTNELAKQNPIPESEITQPDFDGVFIRERWELVSGVIALKLNEQETMIINLAFRCGLNYAEIGRMLGVSRAACQGVASRALKKVRCELLRRKRLFND
jgi:RNA polymerase sigma factor (sigma-70 family)